MQRRSNGEGNVYQRPDGRWEGRLQLDGRRISVYGRTRSEVLEGVRRLQGQAEKNGRLPQNPKQNLGEFLQAWLEAAEGRLRPTTYADYSVMTRLHVVPHVGATRLNKVVPLQLARLYTTLGKAGLSSRRVRMVHDFLHKALADAVKWGLIATSPVATVQAPKREDPDQTVWTPEQVQAFTADLVAGHGGHYGPMLLHLLASGCRIGEALGLRWSDVDFATGTVRIERQVVQIGKAFHEGPPKTRSGVRTVALPDFGLAALRQQKATNAERRLRLGPAWPNTERVFVTFTGTTPERANVKRALHDACNRLGLPRLSPHGLRHLHLSLLAMNGVPLKAAQARAGHSSPVVTLKVYQHVLGNADREAAEVLERALAI
ncbi:MAG: tyrosine-type recombinase/integrase [Chloroflexota bacterium]